MPIRGAKDGGAPTALNDLESLTIQGRTRADGVHLTAAEANFLQDPHWITEDEAMPS